MNGNATLLVAMRRFGDNPSVTESHSPIDATPPPPVTRAQALQVPEAILRELDHQWREHAGQPLLERPWASCESTINGAAGWFATHLGTRLRELGLK